MHDLLLPSGINTINIITIIINTIIIGINTIIIGAINTINSLLVYFCFFRFLFFCSSEITEIVYNSIIVNRQVNNFIFRWTQGFINLWILYL